MESLLVKEYEVTDNDPFIKDHRVNDVPIMPGIVFFNFIAKTLNSYDMNMSDILFKNIVFVAPIVPQKGCLKIVQIIIDVKSNTISARSYEDKKKSVTEHYFCNYEMKNKNKIIRLDFNKKEPLIGDMGRCYDVTSNVGITHHASMKRSGDLYEGDERLLVELKPDNDRQNAVFSDCKLNPSLLDCATVAPMYYFEGHASEKTLYVPFSIDSVWINPEKFNTSTSILTFKPESINKNNETYSLASHLFDDNGTVCASIVGFKVKKVRSVDSFTYLGLKNKGTVSNNNSISTAQIPDNKYERFLLSTVEKITGNVADIEAAFFDIGLDSADLLDIASQIEDSFSTELYPTAMFEYNNIKKMATYLADLTAKVELTKTEDREITKRIKDILFSYSGKAFCVDDDFFAVGMDSSDLLEITADLEKEFKTQIYPSLLFEHTTIESLSKYIESLLLESSSVTDEISDATKKILFYANKKLLKSVNEKPVTNSLSNQKSLLWEAGDVKKCTGILNKIYSNITLLDESINFESLSCYENLIYVTTGLQEEDSDIENTFNQLKELGNDCKRLKISSIIFISASDSKMCTDRASMVGAYGISALFKVFAKENNLSYTQLFINDIDHQDTITLSNLLVVAKDKEVTVDNGVTIENQLAKFAVVNSKENIFKQEGVYIILGGTGGIGQYLANYLMQKYNSTVIIVGRNLDKLNNNSEFNAESIDTYQADISKLPELEGMFEYCLFKYNVINGVFHCAMLLEDSLISKMSYKSFILPLLPKFVGTKNLIKATENIDLDFICFFSSIQSYICNYGQANYASASRYMDEYIRSIRHTRRHSVFTVNWGYWSEIGAVSSNKYNDIMKRSGMIPVDKEVSLMSMEHAMSNNIDEFAIFNGEKNVLDACNVAEGVNLFLSGQSVTYDFSNIMKNHLPDDVRKLKPLFSRLDNIAFSYINTLNKKYKKTHNEYLLNSNNIITFYKRLASELNFLLENSNDFTDSYELDDLNRDMELLVHAHPVLKHFCEFLFECLINIESVLLGKTEAVSLFLSSNVFNALSYIYANNPVSNYYNKLVAEAVNSLVEKSESVKIIELGAGTGSTTDQVLSLLEKSGIKYDYTFSDIGEKFITNARDKYKENPNIECIFYDVSSTRLDINRSQYDVVIATNVIHATTNIVSTLNNVKSLLKIGGIFVLNENIKKNNYSTFTFGLLRGWWSHNDDDLRLRASPLLSEERWKTLLRLNGFNNVEVCVVQDTDNEQQVFVSKSNGIYEKQSAISSSNNKNFISSLSLKPQNIKQYKCIKHFTDKKNNNWIIIDSGKGNILTSELVKELIDIFQRIEGQGRIIYLSHSQGAFSLGGDRVYIADIINNNYYQELKEYADLSKKLINVVSKSDSIVIAIVNGSAQGGGLETLLCTDYQFVSPSVKLGFPEVRSGLIPGMGGMTYLTQQIGVNRAKQLLLTGELISAKKAERWGIISHVSDDPYAAATLFSDQLTHLPTALWMKKFITEDTNKNLTSDIDVWLNYIKERKNLIDVNYIEKTNIIINRDGKGNNE